MNSSRQARPFVVVLLLIAGAAVAAAIAWIWSRQAPSGAPKTPQGEKAAELSAWIADWQWSAGVEDLKKTAGRLDSLQIFAAYFDESDRLRFTDEFLEGFPQIREAAGESGRTRLDLTLVNDILRADGTESRKDTALLSRLVADEESRSRHIAEIEEAANRYGFGGVELDYEKVSGGDWDNFCKLIAELYPRLQRTGKTLRVVLEPGAPFDRLQLPEGPVYVVMAYNLYGGHSGPGPKADDAFIRKLAARMAALPGSPGLALATGGFVWPGDSGSGSGKAAGITERQAALLAEKSPNPPSRDKDSGSLHFEFTDADKKKRTVWYADGATLARWAQTAREAGLSSIAIWRLGELGEGTLEGLAAGFAASDNG
ncbi:glycosyl hydrolase family 18 protein [Cohnella thermotolerans]|uniref:glycosyl hydrolase family 18 protein n=1 Tax=Cohnella thermotolerans TaxID=329858 RepID=UPI0003F793F2|nr:glycosyl hydrolase family 18 protein [Cohnella thermotolerans]